MADLVSFFNKCERSTIINDGYPALFNLGDKLIDPNCDNYKKDRKVLIDIGIQKDIRNVIICPSRKYNLQMNEDSVLHG